MCLRAWVSFLFRLQVSQSAVAALLHEHYEPVDDEPERHSDARRAPSSSAAAAQPRMFAARGEEEAAAFAAGESLARARAAPLGERAQAEAGRGDRNRVRHGAQEVTWVPGGRGGRAADGGRDGGRSGGRGGGRSGADGGGGQEHKRRRMQFKK